MAKQRQWDHSEYVTELLWGLLEATNEIPVNCSAWYLFTLKEKKSYNKYSQEEKANGQGPYIIRKVGSHLSEISSSNSISLAAKPRRRNSGATDRAVTCPCHSSLATEPSALPITVNKDCIH